MTHANKLEGIRCAGKTSDTSSQPPAAANDNPQESRIDRKDAEHIVEFVLNSFVPPEAAAEIRDRMADNLGDINLLTDLLAEKGLTSDVIVEALLELRRVK